MATELETQIKGLVLALDPRQVPTLHVLEGQNFLVGAEGPYAAFGSQYLTYERIEDFDDLNVFEIDKIQTSFIFISSGVLAYDQTSQRYYVAMLFSQRATEVFPWTMAFVGGSYYFSKKGMPVIKFNPITSEWLELNNTNSPGIVPNPVAVTDSFGRLIILDNDVVQWSAIDDGQKFEDPDLGAGSQSLSLVGGGAPLAVKHSQVGFVTYTTSGIMRSMHREADNPFTHRIGSEHITLLSPYSISEIRRGVHVFLSTSGLYQYLGDQKLPQEWQPLMSEYLRNNVLINFDPTVKINPTIKFHFDNNTQIFTLSISPNANPRFYSDAYSLYLPKDEWGSFDRVHSLVSALFIESGFSKGSNPGFFDDQGFYHVYTNQAQVEDQTEIFGNTYFQTYFQNPVRAENGVQIASEVVNATVYDKSQYTYTGLYDAQGQLTPRNFGPLDSYINIGLMRLLDPEYADRYTMLFNLVLGVGELVAEEREDYNTITPDVFEDWDILVGEEDWGFNIIPGIGFTARAFASIDGQTPLEDQDVELELLENTDLVRHFTADICGIYHVAQITAYKLNETFQIKTAEPVLKPAGRT